jgi:hypothetical protein
LEKHQQPEYRDTKIFDFLFVASSFPARARREGDVGRTNDLRPLAEVTDVLNVACISLEG